MSEPIVYAAGLVKRYGKETVVNGLDLKIEAGQCYGLLGPNGAGKSTTLRMLLGITQPDAGELRILGHPIPEEAHLARKRIGVTPQEDNLDPDFTVEENLRIYARYFGLDGATIQKRIDELLAFVELDSKRHAHIATLSGGMKRRLTLARSLVNDPDVVFLDEPTTGLDPQVRHLMWSRLRELQRQGKTLLITTHYMEEAERLCDELVIIDDGQVITRGTPADLTTEHVEPEVFELPTANPELIEALGKVDGTRIEQSGTSWYLYTRRSQPLHDALMAAEQTGWLLRPTNLEDVFLRLTRRDLRD